MQNRLIAVLVITFLCAFNSQLSTLYAQGTAFTYQGWLNDGANPANGSYDLTFALFATNSTGVAVAAPVTNSAMSVTNGQFTVPLDFGDQFPGAERWLELGVRTNGNGPFTTLAPRQRITPAPYAITAGGITGGGAVLTDLNASQLASGTVADARLSTNVALRSGGNTFAGDQIFTNGNVGIGTNAPAARLDVAGTVKATAFSGNGAGLTNVPNSSISAPVLKDGNNVTLGRVIRSDNFGATVLTSTGFLVYIPFSGVFYPDLINYTGAGGTGTAYLSDGGGGTVTLRPIGGKVVVYSGSFASLMQVDTVTNGTENNVAFSSQSIDNPTNMPDVGTRSGWKLKTLTRAAAGLPASFVLPITVQ